jgi:tRNA(fMet)-specific endonuclease VapC
MTYLLDTNVCIEYLRRPGSVIARQLTSLSPEDIRLCDVVKAELYYGANRSIDPEKNMALLEAFFGPFVSLPFDEAAARKYGEVRVQLESTGERIGPYDLQIAAIALTHSLTLVTHNTREFGRINHLQLEDWEQSPD